MSLKPHQNTNTPANADVAFRSTGQIGAIHCGGMQSGDLRRPASRKAIGSANAALTNMKDQDIADLAAKYAAIPFMVHAYEAAL